MSFQIDFEKKETYESIKTGITIDAVLRYGDSEVICPAKVDTGSEFCLFARTFADGFNFSNSDLMITEAKSIYHLTPNKRITTEISM